jgi:hypothetical protein
LISRKGDLQIDKPVFKPFAERYILDESKALPQVLLLALACV